MMQLLVPPPGDRPVGVRPWLGLKLEGGGEASRAGQTWATPCWQPPPAQAPAPKVTYVPVEGTRPADRLQVTEGRAGPAGSLALRRGKS